MTNEINQNDIPKEDIPVVLVCFYCHEPMDKDVVIPENSVGHALTYEPCETCQSTMSKGITIFAVQKERTHDHQLPIDNAGGVELFPTGLTMTVTEDFIKEMYSGNDDAIKYIIEKKGVFVPHETVAALIQTYEDAKDEHNDTTESESLE